VLTDLFELASRDLADWFESLLLDAPALADTRYLQAVFAITVKGLPHAYRDQPAEAGQTVVLEATGPAGATWTLLREADRWTLRSGEPASATTRARVSDDALWKLLHTALKGPEAEAALQIEGRRDLAGPLIEARSVIV
jgi:hypothetical protein